MPRLLPAALVLYVVLPHDAGRAAALVHCFAEEAPCYRCEGTGVAVCRVGAGRWAADAGGGFGAGPTCPGGSWQEWEGECHDTAGVGQWSVCPATCGGAAVTQRVLGVAYNVSRAGAAPPPQPLALTLTQILRCNRRPCGDVGRMVRVDSYAVVGGYIPDPRLYRPLGMWAPPDVAWGTWTMQFRREAYPKALPEVVAGPWPVRVGTGNSVGVRYEPPAVVYTVIPGQPTDAIVVAWTSNNVVVVARGGLSALNAPPAPANANASAAAAPTSPPLTVIYVFDDAAEARGLVEGAVLLLLHDGALVMRPLGDVVAASPWALTEPTLRPQINVRDFLVARNVDPEFGDSRLVRGTGVSSAFFGIITTARDATQSVDHGDVETYTRIDLGGTPRAITAESVKELPWTWRCAPASPHHMIYNEYFDTFLTLCTQTCPWYGYVRLLPSGQPGTGFRTKTRAADEGIRIVPIPGDCAERLVGVEVGGMVPTPTGVVVLLALSTSVKGKERVDAERPLHEPGVTGVDLVWVNVTSNRSTGDGVWTVAGAYRWYNDEAAAAGTDVIRSGFPSAGAAGTGTGTGGATVKHSPRIAPFVVGGGGGSGNASTTAAGASPSGPRGYLIGWGEGDRYFIARLDAALTPVGPSEEVTEWAPWSGRDNWAVHPATGEVLWVGAWNFRQLDFTRYTPDDPGVRITLARVAPQNRGIIDDSPVLRCQGQAASSRLPSSIGAVADAGCSEDYRAPSSRPLSTDNGDVELAIIIAAAAVFLGGAACAFCRRRRRRVGHPQRTFCKAHPWDDPAQHSAVEFLEVPKRPGAAVAQGAGWGGPGPTRPMKSVGF